MQLRTDLAIELENIEKESDGVIYKKGEKNGLKITNITIDKEEQSKKYNKPCGEYVTVELPPLTDNSWCDQEKIEVIAEIIRMLIPNDGLALVVGLGNTSITPDALGPKAASQIFATRHISGELARSAGLDSLRPVAAIAPGVLGQTGIETTEIIRSISNSIRPSVIIVIDALASREVSRLGCTVQISNTGISPGSGVGNERPLIDKNKIGVKVVSIGVPTVVDAMTLAFDLCNNNGVSIEEKVEPRGEQMIVTPREIDLLIERASKLISLSLNSALQTVLSIEDIMSLVY